MRYYNGICTFQNFINGFRKVNERYSLFAVESTFKARIRVFSSEERPKQVAALTKELKVSEAVADAIFLFCVHGLYAINQKYNWQRTEEWLQAQQALFQFMQSGMQGVAQNHD